jgi:magnesium-transporting ATPase (P-type)
MDDQPHPRKSDIMNAVMYRNIFGQAIYQIAVLLTLLFAGQSIFDLEYDESLSGFYYTNSSGEIELDRPIENKITLYTIIFHSFVLMQIFNEINSRKLGDRDFNVFKGFFNNGLFLFIIVSTFVV